MTRLVTWWRARGMRGTRRLARELWGDDAPTTLDEITKRAVADGVVSAQDLFDAAFIGIGNRNKLTRR